MRATGGVVMAADRIDVEGLRERVDLVQIVSQYVALKNDGSEWKGCCPFHSERSPSFYVAPEKGFVHCFGCGAHHDVVGFVQRAEGVDFLEACKRLGGEAFSTVAKPAPVPITVVPGSVWVPVSPVPEHAPDLMRADGWTVPVWNPKRGKLSRFRPSMVADYRDAQGALLGYVLRCEFDDGKITPTITWCIGPDGAMQWCIHPFARPRPLFGLDALAAKPGAPVLLVEGEKCRAAGAGALAMYAVVSWPGGGKGVRYVDWRPLAGRDVVLWPDADVPGQQAMLGWRDYSGLLHEGIAQRVHRAGARSMRYIDVTGQPDGWDIADALDAGWTPKQVAVWAAQRVAEIEMVAG